MRHGFRVLDSDLHVIEPTEVWTEYLDPAHRGRVEVPDKEAEGGGAWLRVDGRALPAHADDPDRQRQMQLRYLGDDLLDRLRSRPEGLGELLTGTTPAGMRQAMAVEGIDAAVVFRTFAAHAIAFDDLDPPFAAAVCTAFNRWLADFCRGHEVLHVGAQVPLQDPATAAAVAVEAIEHHDARTLVLPSHPVAGRPLYDRAYDRLWAVAADADVAVSFHGTHASYTADMLGNRYLDNFVLGHAAGQAVELMLALGAVVAGGVAARFPTVRFAFLEGGCSWLPWWLRALDERFEAWGGDEALGQGELPSEVFARQCFVAVETDEPHLAHVVAEVGTGNLVLSTDWPHDDSRYPAAIDTFCTQPVPDDVKRAVLWDSCARLYGLD